MFTREIYKKITTITAEALVSTSTGVFSLTTSYGDKSIRVRCSTGAIFVTPNSTAPGSSNGWRLAEDDHIDFRVPSTGGVSVAANTSDARWQLLVWDD